MLECIECREEKSLASFPLLYGKFLLSRLEKGQGLTVANTLRRVLLYEIPAVGITSVSIQKNRNAGLEFDAGIFSQSEIKTNSIPYAEAYPQSWASNSESSMESTKGRTQHRTGLRTAELLFRGANTPTLAQQNSAIDLNTHEFSTLPGLKESVLEVLFNLKSIIFRQEFPYDSPQKVLLYMGEEVSSLTDVNTEYTQYQTTEPRIIKAAHLKLPENISLVFPDQYIAEISDRKAGAKLEQFRSGRAEASGTPFLFECTIDKITQNALSGLGTSTFKGFGATQGAGSASGVNPATQNRRILPIDGSVFPVKKVNYTIEYDTFGKEVVFLEIWTNGALQPQEVLNQALEKVLALFQKFTPFT